MDQGRSLGHHACGTCQMGNEPHCTDTSKLKNSDAVLDSSFRVHGVDKLRVVDASIFPNIPGYFIATPTFMIGEKAADVLLEDCHSYPQQLEAVEAAAIMARRNAAKPDSQPTQPNTAKLPKDTIGLALSGGGIRSATFCLGVIQALAKCKRLRDIDIVSSASGGGYIAAFLGRLFTRIHPDVSDKAARVESILKGSPKSTGCDAMPSTLTAVVVETPCSMRPSCCATWPPSIFGWASCCSACSG
ncbi:patatin-like phospholipase family protein [Pseudomonas shirazica]|nr:patatin-like phospholipase family protein [Pseudomonas shirazica]